MVITAGRTDLKDFWLMSGILTATKLAHHPILVFVDSEEEVEVQIFDNAESIRHAYLTPDSMITEGTKCMAQWEGKWRSDFFQFTVGELLAELNK